MAMEHRKTTRQLERRYTAGEVEVRSKGDKTVIEGYAAMFSKRSTDLGGFVEEIRAGAFTKTVKEADVRALFNHDENLVLGRTRSGTLELSQDNSGLYYRVSPPDTSYARDLLAIMERGDVTQSSFAFYKVQDDWSALDSDMALRSLIEVKLVDVSPVTYPAYPDATSGLSRAAALDSLVKRSQVSLEELADAEAILRAVKGDVPEAESEPVSPTTRNLWDKRLQYARYLERMIKES